MTKIYWTLCISLFSSTYLLAIDADTLPLSSKTKVSTKNPDTLDLKEDPAPMISEESPLTKKAQGKGPQNDTLELKEAKKDKKEDEKKKNQPESATGTQSTSYIGSIDVYGTERVTEVDLKELFGKELDNWVELGMAADPKAFSVQEELAAKAKKKWDFAFAEWSLAQYFTPNGLAVHLTLDVVEKKDVPERMPFLPEPTGTFTDPDGILGQWRLYESMALKLVEEGKILTDGEPCVAYHCPFGHKHEKLKPFEKVFVEGAKKHHVVLFDILKKEKRSDMRSAAAFVLPYYKNGKEIVSGMVERIPDPDFVVRNNVLRVLGDIAEFHREIPVPLAPVLKAFNFPRVSDRSKALVVAFQLAEASPAAREMILKTAIPPLLQMVSSKQPDHRELAYGILRKVSGRDFPLDDEKSWKRWYRTVAKENDISKK